MTLAPRLRFGSFGWASLGALGPQAATFLGLLITARVLTPMEFGLAALVTTVAGFATIFVNTGLSAYVVHAPTLSSLLLSTIFWINAACGAVIAGVVYAAAGPIGGFFQQPELPPLIRLSSLSFILSIGAAHLGVLERGFRFRALAAVDTAAAIVVQVMAVGLALLGLGASALVVASLTGQAFQLMGLVAITRWRPGVRFARDEAGAVWRYTRHVVGFAFINYWARNLDNLVIARLEAGSILGLYTRAYAIMMLPVNLVAGVIGRVLLPTLARQQDSQARINRIWTEHIDLSLTIGMPVMVVFIGVPDLVLRVLLGEGWVGASFLVQVLALAIAPQLLMRATGSLLQATGRTRALLVIGVINSTISAAFILLGGGIAGVNGVAVGASASYFFHVATFMVYARSQMEMRLRVLAMLYVRALVLSSVSLFVGWWIRLGTEGLPIAAQLFCVSLAVCGSYLAVGAVFARRSLTNSWNLLRGRQGVSEQ